jgi:hypothetical protein
LAVGVIISLLVLLAPALVFASSAHATWLPPVAISETGEHVSSPPQVVLDAQGDATAVWSEWDGDDTVVESSYRPAGEGWQAPVDISEASGATVLVPGEHDAAYPRIAVDGDGDVTVVWERSTGADETAIQAASRPAGGDWQAPVDVSEPSVTASDEEPWVAADERGDVTAVWKREGVVQSALRPAGEGWQAPVDVSEPGVEALTPQAAADAAGDATAVWMIEVEGRLLPRTAYRPAGGDWGAPTDIADGEEGGDPQIALDAHGDTLVVWTGNGGGGAALRGAYRPAGAEWQAPVAISAGGEEVQFPRLALDAHGDALVVWGGDTYAAGGYERVKVAYRPAGGAWEAATALSEDGGNASPGAVAFDQQGNAVVIWQRQSDSEEAIQAAYRPAGGAWEAPTSLSEPGTSSSDPMVVLDAEGEATAAQGDATAVWASGSGGCHEPLKGECADPTVETVEAAGFDAEGAPAKGLEAPATGVVGTPVALSASPKDAWSPELAFGEGTSVAGVSATHTYTSPGDYTITFSSTEVLGYRGSTRQTIVIEPAPGGGGGSGSSSSGKSSPEQTSGLSPSTESAGAGPTGAGGSAGGPSASPPAAATGYPTAVRDRTSRCEARRPSRARRRTRIGHRRRKARSASCRRLPPGHRGRARPHD